MWPAESMYQWEGEVVKEGEKSVFFKTLLEKKDELVKSLENLHPYTVPCIIVKKVEANNSYYNWMSSILT